MRASSLLLRGDRRRALSELLVLSAGLPDDVATQVSAGRMYLEIQEPLRAGEHFDRALALEPAHPGALAGAGEAAFAQGDYIRARRLLAMVPGEVPAVADLRTVAQAFEVTRSAGRPACLVGSAAAIAGVVPVDRLRDAVEQGRGADPVASVTGSDLVHVHPDHSLDVVFDRFGQSAGLLPVVSRQDVRRLEGVVTLEDIARSLQRRPRPAPADAPAAS